MLTLFLIYKSLRDLKIHRSQQDMEVRVVLIVIGQVDGLVKLQEEVIYALILKEMLMGS